MSIDAKYIYNRGLGHAYVASGSMSCDIATLPTGQFVAVETRGVKEEVVFFAQRLLDVLSDSELWSDIDKRLTSYSLQFSTRTIFCLEGESKFYLNFVSSELERVLSSLETSFEYSPYVQASVAVLFPIPSGEYGYVTVGSNVLVKGNFVLNYPEILGECSDDCKSVLHQFYCGDKDLVHSVRPKQPTAIYQKGVLSDLQDFHLMSYGVYEIFTTNSHPLLDAVSSSLHVFEPRNFTYLLNQFLSNGYFWLGIGIERVVDDRIAHDVNWMTTVFPPPRDIPELSVEAHYSDTVPFDTSEVLGALSEYDQERHAAKTHLFTSPGPDAVGGQDQVMLMDRAVFEPLIETRLFNASGQPVHPNGELIENPVPSQVRPSVKAPQGNQFENRQGGTQVFSIPDPRFLIDPHVYDPGTQLVDMKALNLKK